MLDEAFERLPCQIQAIETRVTVLELGDEFQGMRIVIEAAESSGCFIQRLLARMPERRMSQIVRQRDGLRQVLVQGQNPRQGAGDLRHFEAMRQAGAVEIAFVLHEHLRLVLEAPEGGGMDDTVAITLIAGAGGALRLGMEAAAAFGGMGGTTGKA